MHNFPKITADKRNDLITFFFLYIAQSMPMTFFSTALQVTMRQASFSLSSIALLQLVKLPWILKMFWSPIVDKKCNSYNDYRRCIFYSEGIYAALILLVGHLNLDTDFYFIVVLIFLSLMASATQDIATDALAVLCFDKKEKSLVNSMQSLGSFSAALIGSGFLLALLHRYGWHVVTPCLAVFVLLAILPLERNKTLKIQQVETSEPVSLADFAWFFTRKSIWKQIGFLVLYYAGIIGSLSVLRPYLVDLGYSMKDIGFMSGVLGSLVACIASLISGHGIIFFGRFACRRIIAFLSVLATGYWVLLTQMSPSTPFILVGLGAIWLCYGLSTVVVYTTAMDNVRPGREGTDFTVQTVITHISGLLISLLSGNIADRFGYHNLFVFECALAIFTFFYVFLFFKKEQSN